MGYRLPEPSLHYQHVMNAAMPTKVCMDNGTIMHLSIPCFRDTEDRITWYDVQRIDHHGWPTPDSVDHSFQPIQEHDGPQEIDLVAEGYSEVEVAFFDAPDGLTGYGHIDVNIVRAVVNASCETLMDTDADVRFAIYAKGIGLKDVVAKGILHIVAGPFDTEE